MAGDPTPIINNWILDYNTYYAWEEFKSDHSLSPSTLDSISGILCKNWEGDEHGNDKKLFLTVLSRLKDGEDLDMRYDETSDVTPLEDMVTHFMNLINHQIDDKLLQEGDLLLKVIKCEAVQVCCRAGQFEKAQEVFDRFFQHDKRDKIARTLKKQISKKNKDIDLTYKDFITAVMEYLEQISDSFDEPTIITAAKIFMEMKPCGNHGNGEKEKEGEDRIPQREILDDVQENSISNNNISRDKKKLRRLWDNKIKEIFGTDGPAETVEPDSASKSPFKEPPTPNGLTSKTLKRKKIDSDHGASQSLFKKPSSPKEPDTVSSRKSSEKASTSRQSSATPKKAGQVSNISPVKKLSVSDSSEEDSPALKYKKNKGRPDRHEPVMSSTRCEVHSDDDMEVLSVCSFSTKRKWREDEMLEFYDAVQTFGIGRWAKIKDYLNTTRTNVMLKDKWRNMVKSGDVDKIRERRKKKKK